MKLESLFNEKNFQNLFNYHMIENFMSLKKYTDI